MTDANQPGRESDQDRVESEEIYAQAAARREELLALIPQFSDRLDRLNVQPGSQLFNDDAATPYDPISFQARSLLVNAVDHLEYLGEHFRHSESMLRPIAHYTVIRSVMEASALCIWLLEQRRRDQRVLRSVRLTWHNRQDVVSLAKVWGRIDAEGAETVRSRLIEIKDRRGKLRQSSLDSFPTTTSILENVEKYVLGSPLPGLAVWKACSGMAHANKWTGLALLERRRVPDGDGRTYLMTSRLSVVVLFWQAAMHYIGTALTMFEQASESE